MKPILVFGFVASGALCLAQTYVPANFEQYAAPSGCVRYVTTTATTGPTVPALKTPGVTFSGGQVLGLVDPYGNPNRVYATQNICLGVQSSITITFDGTAQNVNFVVGSTSTAPMIIDVKDNTGYTQTLDFTNYQPFGLSVFLSHSNITRVTLTMQSAYWTGANPTGFYVDNLSSYLTQQLSFVDPNPDLLTGNGVVSDAQSLAIGGTLVQAVAADGVTRLVLRAAAVALGDKFTLTVLNDSGSPSHSSTQDGGLAAVGSGPGSQSNSVKVSALDSSSGPMAMAVYYPPADFSRGTQDDGSASRQIQIQVDSPGRSSYRKTLTILRAPVVVVHDMWGDPADWDVFGVVNDGRFFVRRAAYNRSLANRASSPVPAYASADMGMLRESSLGIGYNAPGVLRQIAGFINEFRLRENAAAAQADVVAQGMGGAIARSLVKLPGYLSPESFGAGSIHKLITVGTPHLGTPFATALLQTSNACVSNVYAHTSDLALTSVAIDGKVYSGATGDLQGNGLGGGLSAALSAMAQGGPVNVPTAFVAAAASSSNLTSLDATNSVAHMINQACASSPLAASLTSTGIPKLFGGSSDGFVPLVSQLAGRNGQTYTGIIHSRDSEAYGFSGPSEMDNTQIHTGVIQLLNTQSTDSAFYLVP